MYQKCNTLKKETINLICVSVVLFDVVRLWFEKLVMLELGFKIYVKSFAGPAGNVWKPKMVVKVVKHCVHPYAY